MPEEFFDYPVDGTLDLHMFLPRDARSALEEYLFTCRQHGVLRVRIIHGKGQGVLRRMVHAVLRDSPFVREFATPSDYSGWGATIAILAPLDGDVHEDHTEA